MSSLDDADVRAAFARWRWVPPGAPRVQTEELLIVRLPDHFPNPLQLLRAHALRPVADLVDEALAQARRLGDGLRDDALTVWVRLDAPAGLEEEIVARGGRLDEAVDAFALDLADGHRLPETPETTETPGTRSRVELRWVTDTAAARDMGRLAAEIFGGDPPTEADAADDGRHGAASQRTGTGGAVLAYVDGRPAAYGGLTIAGRDARLWGGGVLEPYRGRGLYRAILATRLAYAAEHGAQVALVRGRTGTSAPILRRAGFGAYGQERSYRLSL
ncbi:GNAT family N-acetyltransferase [Nocardioides sp. KR10-350]|uniref:GNAT family N-acetyltransferase n=1 Tax=Nocardioides cheoyonin TaxID=3156615 RepID=UPI0032B40BBA